MTRAVDAILAIARGFRALIGDQSLALTATAKAAMPRRELADLRAMYTADAATALQGQLLRLSDRREVAIYLRDDALWVADFVDGHGEIIDAVTWFRFNCGTTAAPFARRRMAHEFAIPLSAQLAARIEALHVAARRKSGEGETIRRRAPCRSSLHRDSRDARRDGD